MSVRDFKLPDLGEGLTESELVGWRVAVGDLIELNQVIAEVETAKALVELPSPFAGVVARLYGEPGETIRVGSPLMSVEVPESAVEGAPVEAVVGDADLGDADSDGGRAGGADSGDAESGHARSGDAAPVDSRPERTPVLVGYGPTVGTGEVPKRKARVGVEQSIAVPGEVSTGSTGSAAVSTGSTGSAAVSTRSTSAGEVSTGSTSPAEVSTRSTSTAVPGETPRSTPPVRKLAASLGVDLAHVVGSGSGGLITREDVQSAASRTSTAPSIAPEAASAPAPVTGADRRTPIAGVRKLTAEAMVASAFTAPHATVFLDVDVTRSMRLVEKLRATPEYADRRLNLLTVVARAVTLALASHPTLNARWDAAANEIVEFASINLGIAAATPRGLMVPNLKGTEQLRLPELADALTELVATARAGRTGPGQLTGGTFSISNVGVFGVDAGTPSLNPGESGILAIGAVRRRPWEHRGKLKLRDVMTLSLSFDHRVVDGEQGSRFLAEVGAMLEEPGLVLARI